MGEAFTRVFIVGCSRSGTTVVQREISETFGLWTLPETGYFLKPDESFFAWFKRIYAVLLAAGCYRPGGNALRKLFRFTTSLFLTLGFFKTFRIFTGSVSRGRAFCWLMDSLADPDANGWLEKTPLHFRSINQLLETHEDAKVVFIVRNGLDTVASIYDRSQKYPGVFGEQTIEQAIELWNESIGQLLHFHTHQRVYLFSFENFCADPTGKLNELAELLGAGRNTSQQKSRYCFVNENELWKDGMQRPLSRPPGKAEHVFLDEQLKEISSKLLDVPDDGSIH